MAEESITNRANMPKSFNPVLERRTVDNANRNLLKFLRPGLSMLDVGCGSGAITRSIAEKTGSTGRVLGIDPSEHLINQANQQAGDIPGLAFQLGDVYSFDTAERFDLVTCARTLQWLAQPEAAIQNMKRFVKPGGHLAILDFNHEKISWTPEPPESMRTFYDAFLQWRQDAGFDNAIADHLKEMMHTAGFEVVQVENQFEITHRNDPDFAIASRLWAEVAELRGPQLVIAGYITDDQRLQAITDYDHWIATVGESMNLYLLAVEGQQPV
jgi:ubiquinone/menaquinone biosynthesis C-methylase UbiE